MIISLLDSELFQFLSEIETMGIKLCLVGGAVRDYFIDQHLNEDLDFEIRLIGIHKLDQILEDFFNSKQLKFEKLPYQIYRINFKHYSLEFSPPRIEKFQDGNLKHHNFEAEIDYHADYSKSFKRRDFTINAIGIEFDFAKKEEKVIDPYNGLNDLKLKILKNVSEDFSKDSVRFLRMIRFETNLNFVLDKSLKEEIKKFDLSELSKYHFESELFKAKSISNFLENFKNLNQSYNLKLNSQFSFFTKIKASNLKAIDRIEFSCWIACFEEDFLDECMNFFVFKKNMKQDLLKIKKALVFLSKKEVKKFNSNQEFFESDLFYHLKFLNNTDNLKFIMLKYLNLKESDLLLSWSDWENVNLSKYEIKAEGEKFRSSLKLYKAFKIKYGN